jgi:hypothetical protein
MESAKKPKQIRSETTCIDLPGESVQCWSGNLGKLKIVLRKHRDIVFDIKLFKGTRYEIVASGGDVYDTRCKKIVSAGESLYFLDGERLHLWISRKFRGEMLLKANGKTIGSYFPDKVDCPMESEDPLLKPAPMMVILHNDIPTLSFKTWNVMQPDGTYRQDISSSSESKLIEVVEIPAIGVDVPREISEFFKNGGEKELLPSDGIATRNWVLNAVVGQLGYASDNGQWIKELWGEKVRLVTVNHRNSGRKLYVVLTGSARRRLEISASRYGVANAKVLAFTFGAGSGAGIRHGAWAAVKGGFKNGGMCAIMFTIAIDIAEWTKDYEEVDPKTGRRKKDFSDLVIKIGVDIAKNALVTLATALTMAGIVLAGPSIAVIVVGTVVFTIIYAIALDIVDKHTGASDKVGAKIKRVLETLDTKMPADYKGYNDALMQAVAYGAMGS